MHTKHRLGHLFIVFGMFSWIALSLAVNYTPARAKAISSGDILSLSNQQRSANGLPALTAKSQLNAAAAAKAAHMRDNNYFAHTAPDGTTGWSFISAQGYSYSNAGENLASSNQGASSVVNGWMNSSGHRANLLSSTYTEVGHGVAYVGTWTYQGTTYSNTYFVVALYTKPKSTPPPPPADPPAPEPEPTQQVSSTPPPSTSATPPATPSTQPTVEPELEETVEPEEPEESTPAVENQTSEEESSEEKQVIRPVASVAPSQDTLISPALAVGLATAALGLIVTGVFLEIKWVKKHGHIQHIHFPDL